MTDLSPSVVPADDGHYYEQAREICHRVRHKSHLADDEIIILAVVAAQLALAKYVEPGPRNSDETLDKILSILDHTEVVAAIGSKMDTLLNGQKTITRMNAPAAVPTREGTKGAVPLIARLAIEPMTITKMASNAVAWPRNRFLPRRMIANNTKKTTKARTATWALDNCWACKESPRSVAKRSIAGCMRQQQSKMADVPSSGTSYGRFN